MVSVLCSFGFPLVCFSLPGSLQVEFLAIILEKCNTKGVFLAFFF